MYEVCIDAFGRDQKENRTIKRHKELDDALLEYGQAKERAREGEPIERVELRDPKGKLLAAYRDRE